MSIRIKDRARPLLAILLVLALAGGLRAASPADLSSGFVPEWAALAAAGLAVGVGVTALLYMIGEAGRYPSVKAFARNELQELIMSAVLVAVVAGALVGLGLLAQNISHTTLTADKQGAGFNGYCAESCHLYPVAGDTAVCPGASDSAIKGALDQAAATHPENALFADADWFLGCMPSVDVSEFSVGAPGQNVISATNFGDTQHIQADAAAANEALRAPDTVLGHSKGIMSTHLMNIYVSLFSLEFMLGPISTFGVSGFLPEGGLLSYVPLDVAPNAGLTPISEATIMLTDLIGVGLASIFMQKTLLQFIHQNALVVFLPLGLGFRGVPFLRKTGSTIIAAALVMYFVFPASIWVNQQVYAALSNPDHPVLQPWANYPDVMALCQLKPGESQADYIARIQTTLAPEFVKGAGGSGTTPGVFKNDVLDLFWNTFFKQNGAGQTTNEVNSGNVQAPVSQQRALLQSLDKNFNIIHNYVLNYGWALGPVIPTQYFFEQLIDQISNSMQYFVLSMLFLVNTLIMSVTLFRDFSLAIGGEPRIFGMSKLV